ncbi:hypothetical protein MCW_00398 [Cardidatus Bartonella washoeensis 085-0475]|uniref:Uncharacterized protein n=1 Tax=Cardidatus Bartonella washoeensis 085-0475 TaxID=1094564 RepID=J1JP25_9HYPH|nr:hypothetical protein MCW_00398 [Bartonella washoeensis 085-0475]
MLYKNVSVDYYYCLRIEVNSIEVFNIAYAVNNRLISGIERDSFWVSDGADKVS